jgi:uncharacterized membrane protein
MTYTAGLIFMLAVATCAADAPKLRFKFTSVEVPGAKATFTTGINNAGVMVGTYEDSAGTYHGYILKDGKVTTLDAPHSTTTSVGNIKPNGSTEIVGGYLNARGRELGFLYINGHYSDIRGPKGSTAAAANAINDDGDIVGSYKDSNGVTEGYLLTKHGYTSFNVFMSQINAATGINDKGKLVYWSVSGISGDTTSYLYDIKTQQSTEIDVPGATDSLAQDINNEGDITFEWLDSAGGAHGALLHAGKYYKFEYPKSPWGFATGLNDRNVMVGDYEAVSGGPFEGFKATY